MSSTRAYSCARSKTAGGDGAVTPGNSSTNACPAFGAAARSARHGTSAQADTDARHTIATVRDTRPRTFEPPRPPALVISTTLVNTRCSARPGRAPGLAFAPLFAFAAFAAPLLPAAGCDPLVDVAGAFFPGWMVCILVAVASTVLIQRLLSRTRLEPTLGPLVLVYPSLAATIALGLWLGFYRHFQ